MNHTQIFTADTIAEVNKQINDFLAMSQGFRTKNITLRVGEKVAAALVYEDIREQELDKAS